MKNMERAPCFRVGARSVFNTSARGSIGSLSGMNVCIVRSRVHGISLRNRTKKGYGILRVNIDICRKINIY